ncbi:MAG TPA: hypothetical protein PLT12_00850, partial [Kiritimatiellia bacterium]|nr:hypothetical protein [Kiritimatiellia bacterium]
IFHTVEKSGRKVPHNGKTFGGFSTQWNNFGDIFPHCGKVGVAEKIRGSAARAGCNPSRQETVDRKIGGPTRNTLACPPQRAEIIIGGGGGR